MRLPIQILDPAAILSVWREIFSASRQAQQPVRVAYLGPEGTFTQQAAMSRFGTSVELVASNNRLVATKQEWQYLVYTTGPVHPHYTYHAKQLLQSDKLTEVQRLNVQMNLQLIAAQDILNNQKETPDDLEF